MIRVRVRDRGRARNNNKVGVGKRLRRGTELTCDSPYNAM